MIRQFILFLLINIISTLSFGQKIGNYYVSISSDSTANCRLMFLNDSIVELSNIPRHMGRHLTMIFHYISDDTIINILPRLMTKEDSLSLNKFGFSYFIKQPIRLSKIKGGFIDRAKSLIYVKQKDFGDNPDIAYIIDGKTFIQDVGVTDGYGLIKKNPKTNKALQKKFKIFNKENCTIESLKGLEAYKRYGIKRVYGVVVITTRQ